MDRRRYHPGALINCIPFILLIYIHVTTCVRLNKLLIPSYKMNGENALFECQYDLENDTLYAVKWYHDEEEFYRFLPRNDPPKFSFVLPGITVNVSLSNDTAVYLDNLNISSSGVYRCEVSAEAPSFRSVFGEQKLDVIHLAADGPFITAKEDIYKIGDNIDFNCTSGKTFPVSSLEWYINDEMIDKPPQVREHVAKYDREGYLLSMISIRLPITKAYFDKQRLLRIRCIAKLSPNSWKDGTISVTEKDTPVIEVREAAMIVKSKDAMLNPHTDDISKLITLACPIVVDSGEDKEIESAPLPDYDSDARDFVCTGYRNASSTR